MKKYPKKYLQVISTASSHTPFKLEGMPEAYKKNVVNIDVGKYKNTYWEFQKEKRYILRFLPISEKDLRDSNNRAQTAYDAFFKTKEFLSYYDLSIRDDAFQQMEITLAPQFTAGNQVLLDSGSGITTRYAHMTRYIVAAGQTVTAGQVIGYVGSTGLSTGNHLHFEVSIHGELVDPLTLIS